MKKQNNKFKLIYTSIIIIIAIIISYTAIKFALKSSNVFDNHCYIEARYKRIPILMYHSISKKSRNVFTVSPGVFEKQMKSIKDSGYTAVSLDEFYNYLNGNGSIPKKSVVITFDDGYEDNYKYAYPVLKKYNFKAVFFIIASNVDNNNYYMKSNQIKEMSEDGFDIGSHTVNHDHLSKMNYEKQKETLEKSKQILENITGKDICYISYPFGEYNENTIRAAKACKYKMAFTVTTNNMNYEDIFTLHRNLISRYTNMDAFLKLYGLSK